MRRFRTLPALFAGVLLLGACAEAEVVDALGCYVARGSAEEALERPSPLRETPFVVGGSAALLCYGAPSVRGREIMGGLLVYGQPERIGANEPTTIHLTGPANVGSVDLEAGSYSIYAIANEDEWEIFINSNWERWGIPISNEVRAAEVGSFTATPEPLDEMVETLTYSFEPTDEGMGDVVLEWENTRVKFHVHPGA